MSGDHDPRLELPAGHIRARRRLAWSVGLAAGAVLAATVVVPSYAEGGDEERSGADAFKQAAARTAEAAVAEAQEHDHSGHDHTDPATKNLISRSVTDEDDPLTKDPTTKAEIASNTAAVAARRDDNEPTLLPGLAPSRRRATPEDRYAMAGGCYAIGTRDRWVKRSGDGFRASARRVAGAEPLHFQATDLGKYLLYGTKKDFVAAGSGDPLGLTGASGVVAADKPSTSADWTVVKRGGTFRFRLPAAGKALGVDAVGNLVLADTPARFAIRRTDSCARWPEVKTNVSG
ncbi:MAG TPA: hypothetical protein VLH10_16310, partial [Yinghuangia sp.]|nr:hypothetical protein [Yinghuangia sp.]